MIKFIKRKLLKRKQKKTVEKLEKSIGKEIKVKTLLEGEEKTTAGKLKQIDPDLGIVIELHRNGISILPLQIPGLIREVKLDGKIIFSQE